MQAYKKCCVPIAFVQMYFMQQFIAQIKELFKVWSHHKQKVFLFTYQFTHTCVSKRGVRNAIWIIIIIILIIKYNIHSNFAPKSD
jgi:hypothetical protein